MMYKKIQAQIPSFLISLSIFLTHQIINAQAQNLKQNCKDVRGPEQFEIRILVVFDSTMKDHHQGDLDQYLQNLFDFVSKFYKDSTLVLKHFVQMKVIKYTILDDVIIQDLIIQDSLKKNNSQGKGKNHSGSIEALSLLENFCDWKINLQTEEGESDFDAAVLLTRRSLHRKSMKNSSTDGNETTTTGTVTVNDVLGVANYGSLCTNWSCAVIRDYAPYTFFNLVHEIGHLLYMHDDESDYCQMLNPKIKSFENKTETRNESYVMESTRYIEEMNKPDFQSTIKWSNCSQIYLKNFLRNSESSCIRAIDNEILL